MNVMGERKSVREIEKWKEKQTALSNESARM